MPILTLGLLILNFLSIAAIWLEVFLLREWYMNKDALAQNLNDYATRCFIGAAALMLYLLGGRYLIRMLSSQGRNGDDSPKLERYSIQQRIQRPDGSVINVEHGGNRNKQSIIFLHGWNSNSMQWYYQKKHFENDYHLILMDQAGLGKSIGPKNKDYSLEKLAADLDSVIVEAGGKDPVLWGHSMGGFAILTYLKLEFQSVSCIKAIILEHTTYTNPAKTSIMSALVYKLQNPVLKPLSWMMIALSPLLWLSRWMSYFSGSSLLLTRFLTFKGTQSPEQLDFAALLSTLAPPFVTGRGLLGMFNYEATSVLPRINIPTLIIGAASDRLTKLEASKHMHHQIPGAELITLSPAGHMGLVERHHEVNIGVSDFLQRLK